MKSLQLILSDGTRPKKGLYVTCIDIEIMVELPNGNYICERESQLRKGQTVQLVRPGINTPWSWMVKEHELEFLWSVSLFFLRKATSKEIKGYKALKTVVD